MRLSHEDVREILRLLDESPYEELKLETDDFSLTLKRSASGRTPRKLEKPKRRKAPRSAHIAGTGQTKQPVKAAPMRPPPRSSERDIIDVYPPLPGTFYRAPQPGAEPFVDVGSKVEEDTVVGLIETMKLMNSVMAGCNGEVLEFCTDNGVMVEAGDVLLRIRLTH